MTQYLKHYYIGYIYPHPVLEDTNQAPGGKIHPPIVGLDVLIQLQNDRGIDYCLSTAPDSSETAVSGVTRLSEQEWKAEWELAFDRLKQDRIKSVYVAYKSLFEALPNEYYHPYEMLYSSYIKRVEAAAVKEGMTVSEAKLAAPTIAIECEARGLDIFTLASRILAHAEQFDRAQAELLAQRGREVDEISAIVCDTASVDTIRASIYSLFPQPNSTPMSE